MEKLKVLLIRMLALLENYYKQLEHLEVMRVASRQQMDLKLTGSMWVHWVLTHPNERTCYERFRMSPKTFELM
jgi:flagellar biosynthesis chaperone FliJ